MSELDDFVPRLWLPIARRFYSDLLGYEVSEEQVEAILTENVKYCHECGRKFEEEDV